MLKARLQTRKWQDKDIIEKYSTDIIADNFTFVGSKSDSSDHFLKKIRITMIFRTKISLRMKIFHFNK